MADRKLLLGCDLGSSSVKVTLLNADTGRKVASASSPGTEMGMDAPKKGRAEQDPDMWWKHLKQAVRQAMTSADASGKEVGAIGVAYQMHGLVLAGKDHNILRPAIIWCDSRAAQIGEKAFYEIGEEYCLEHYLNSPGNFTASKLKWVMENEPEIYQNVHKWMLPGDYITMKMTGNISTTLSGLSEGVFWDFREKQTAHVLMQYFGIEEYLMPGAVPVFSHHGDLTSKAAKELGLQKGTPVTYKAGDQPNNALSLNVLNPGEVAATAGTSGVIFGITDQPLYDPESRVNTFIHVNNEDDQPRNGVLLCINGTGIMNSWLRRRFSPDGKLTYDDMNRLAMTAPPGSDGLLVQPFGNGTERVLNNRNRGARVTGLDLNRHDRQHLFRAAQEGIVFSLRYGFDIMSSMGVEINRVRAGKANMFNSPLFSELFANTTGSILELYHTDGSEGAARGSGIGAGIWNDSSEAFHGLEKLEVIEPDPDRKNMYEEFYQSWLTELNRILR
jgi:xylulokinase